MNYYERTQEERLERPSTVEVDLSSMVYIMGHVDAKRI